MEKRKQSYKLVDIQQQMSDVSGLRLTTSSRQGLVELDFDENDAVAAIQNLTAQDFKKSMTTHRNHKVWQDVYNSS